MVTLMFSLKVTSDIYLLTRVLEKLGKTFLFQKKLFFINYDTRKSFTGATCEVSKVL